MLRKILVGLDGSSLGERALPVVTQLADRLDADVQLLHVMPDAQRSGELPPSQSHAYGDEATPMDSYLKGIAQRMTARKIRVDRAVLVGDRAQQIVGYAHNMGSDLIVLTTHSRSGIATWFYDSVAENVLRASTTPVLLLHPGKDEGSQSGSVQMIVVPLDGSLLSETVLPLAEDLAAHLEVPLVLLRVVEPVYILDNPAVGFAPEYLGWLDDRRATAQRYLQSLAASLSATALDIRTIVSVGKPGDEIVACAHRFADSMVVMATHGRGGLARLVLGSVARQVVAESGVPVILKRPSPSMMDSPPARDAVHAG
jgi:nucleotide-binding universal stress UspA family protein